MPHKTAIIEQLGENALVLPTLVASALQANDRAKYYMSLLLGCREHVLNPDEVVPNLSVERRAGGEGDVALDRVIDGSRRGPDNTIVIPRFATIQQRLIASVEQMCAPLQIAASGAVHPVDSYERRLKAIREQLPAIVDDTAVVGYVDTMTRADRSGPDSIHLLVMDLHRELTRIQSQLAEQVIDGAHAYGLTSNDEALIRSFMRGVNATSPLKFDHPGLETTATHIGDELVIQNDLGTTDAHVIVIHVTARRVSLMYTDVHRARLNFFLNMFDGHGLDWDRPSVSSPAEYESCAGRRTCETPEELDELLAFIGSRLVFLIDWNRARKRLARFVKKADAVAALRWAADHEFGHRAFLETGGERLVYNALERTAAAPLRYGARLDEVLGAQAALEFLEGVLRITSEGLLQRRSLRLIRDEVQAELLDRLQDCEHGVLALAADHAALIVGIAHLLQDALLHMRGGLDDEFLSATSDRAKQWETKADDLVNAARDTERHLPASDRIARLLPAADDVADGLEESIFLMALLPRYDAAPQGVDTLERLTELAVSATQEYVKCVEIARDIRHNGTREDVQEFLIAVDSVITLEHESDEAERHALAAMLGKADNFRALHLLSQVAHGLEESVDALARCALMLKDIVIGEMLVQ
jgi:uncharacterized protein Yka (UPF0111/DUF47 family)